ncbi:DUF3027 domain-containing protein [Microcella sp.]|uniref:DUF3027 domain-containing protein n=1 Tax=Microcella sp. TaxID=1913979 RepID=UPI00256499B8|nr:DUF3027 domain-containing protein [Microcella sp.]MBX9471706.1 DUF3027 domain-containing protein [Microcella sp.]
MARVSKKAAAVDAAVTDAAADGAASATTDAAVLEPIARQALGEITRPANVGALRDVVVADDVATVRFSTTQGGYPGWYWTVAVAVNPGMQPSVLETELIPAEGALTAPDWVPWADRLDDYLAQQAHERELAGETDDDDDDDDDDDEHDDDAHDDDADEAIDEHDVHGDDGDDVFDGVDIDLHLDDDTLTEK